MDLFDEWILADLRAGILYDLGSAIPIEHKRYSKSIEDAKADYELANMIYLGSANQPRLTSKQFSSCQLLMRIGQYHLYKRELENARAQYEKNPEQYPTSTFDWFHKSIDELTDLLVQGMESYLMHLSEAESRPFRQLIVKNEFKQENEKDASPTISKSSSLPTKPKVEIIPANMKMVMGLTKQPIINAFEGLYWNRDKWGKYLASPPDWLKTCRVAKGTKTASATWNPVLIAIALIDKKIPFKRLDSVFVGLKDWTEEWQEKSNSSR
ncbi:MAG TPA: hypothetical protein VIO39_07190 [Methylotenera sp.]